MTPIHARGVVSRRAPLARGHYLADQHDLGQRRKRRNAVRLARLLRKIVQRPSLISYSAADESGSGVVFEASHQSDDRESVNGDQGLGNNSESKSKESERDLRQNMASRGEHHLKRHATLYVQMELVSGGTLHQWIHERNMNYQEDKDNSLKLREAMRLFAQLVDAVLALHRKGIVHRDIKPSNVMLIDESAMCNEIGGGVGGAIMSDVECGTWTQLPNFTSDNWDGKWTPQTQCLACGNVFMEDAVYCRKCGTLRNQGQVSVRLCDFGLAKTMTSFSRSCSPEEVSDAEQDGESHTRGVGTPTYASPEQIHFGSCGPETDAFSLGVVLSELLCPVRTQMERAQLLTGLRAWPHPYLPECVHKRSPHLENLVMSLTKENPEDRYSLSNALLEASKAAAKSTLHSVPSR